MLMIVTFFVLVNKILLGGAKVPFFRALCVKKKARNSLQIPRFRFVLPDFGPAFWSNVHPISFASGEGGMEVIDDREKDRSRSLKASHLGHCFDDGYFRSLCHISCDVD